MSDKSPDTIVAPAAKAASAIAAGVGTSAMSLSQQAQSFLPTDLAGWMALTASTAAAAYSIHLMGEWYWKKVWRPLLERWGWLSPAAPTKVIVIEGDGDVEVTQQ